jgi:cytochrome b561
MPADALAITIRAQAKSNRNVREETTLTKTRYTFLQRLMHWVMALILFGLLAIGLTLWGLGYEGTVGMFGEETAGMFYKYHKTFGILVFLLVILRIVMRRAWPAPAYDPPLGGLERTVSGGIHLLLYLLMIGLPIGGWVATAMSGYPIQFFDWTLPGLVPENKELGEQIFLLHGIGGLAMLLLILIHMAAGLKHWKLKDGIMRRISLP